MWAQGSLGHCQSLITMIALDSLITINPCLVVEIVLRSVVKKLSSVTVANLSADGILQMRMCTLCVN